MKPIRFSNSFSPALPSLLDRFLDGSWTTTGIPDLNENYATMPAINVKEDENGYLIEVAAPGLKKDDFKVEYHNGWLTISSESNEEHSANESKKYSRREFRYSSFRRTFRVPEDTVNSDKIEANYKDGILHIALPKREEVKPKPARAITIG